MPVFCAETSPTSAGDSSPSRPDLVALLTEAGLAGVTAARVTRLFFLEGTLDRKAAERIATDLLSDPVSERALVRAAGDEFKPAKGEASVEVHLRPGVMDPTADSTLAELRAEGHPVESVRTARRYVVNGDVDSDDFVLAARRVLANDCIEQIALGTAGIHPTPQPPAYEFKLRHVPLCGLADEELETLSRSGHLFLTLAEMQTIQAHFRTLQREPTDLELESIAQTWSEHCVHKTLKSAIVYRGAPFPALNSDDPSATKATAATAPIEHRYGNLLKDTIARATRELIAEKRGPECLSVFEDNAGVIGFDADLGVAFKVETHNHPSAIEPYGGAATGAGGCIRDVLGCGLGARPIANTDVFCVAPGDWPRDQLPKGVLHPRRVLRGIVSGVADYGNRMGIPTVNGAVHYDPRYLGNPLVFCGCVGTIPRNRITKAAQPGDHIVLIGGRTGRDGIHGATFSSAELTDAHADEFSHAVQIGNAITEKRMLDALMRARDEAGDCLYSAVTDCGAGGLSSAVGEMAEKIGGVVALERVPLKYAGLRYDEIWISEAQERMVLAVPSANLDRFLEICAAEEVEATVIGTFGTPAAGNSPSNGPRLVLHYNDQVVGDLDLEFLHQGVPKSERVAEWNALTSPRIAGNNADQPTPDKLLTDLRARLAHQNTAAREWIIRQYDHEVQGGTLIKPFVGPGHGPADAAVLRPRPDSNRGIALACGLAPQLSDVDPYWMAIAAIDEAIRNVVCVGGDPRQTALLDNFCWGRSDDPQQLGGLVRACQACYDAAKTFGAPFISGKDSLNNEFALDASDVNALLQTLEKLVRADEFEAEHWRALLPALRERIQRTGRLAIPATLLVSAISLIDDVRRCVSSDLKQPGNALLLVGGFTMPEFSLPAAARVHVAVADAIQSGVVRACHDVSTGGWLTSVAEMAIGSPHGVDIETFCAANAAPFSELCSGYVVEVDNQLAATDVFNKAHVPVVMLGTVRPEPNFTIAGKSLLVSELRSAWLS